MPSRTDVPEYAEYLERIEALVAVVNHRHGTPDWMPINLKLRDDLEEAVAVLQALRRDDGQRDVRRDEPRGEGGPAGQRARRRLDPVARTRARTRSSASSRCRVNPFDVQELADSIHAALTMAPEERARRAEGLKEIVTSRDPGDWIDEQIADIRKKARGGARSARGSTASRASPRAAHARSRTRARRGRRWRRGRRRARRSRLGAAARRGLGAGPTAAGGPRRRPRSARRRPPPPRRGSPAPRPARRRAPPAARPAPRPLAASPPGRRPARPAAALPAAATPPPPASAPRSPAAGAGRPPGHRRVPTAAPPAADRQPRPRTTSASSRDPARERGPTLPQRTRRRMPRVGAATAAGFAPGVAIMARRMAEEQPIYDLILLLDPEAEEERRTNILASLEQVDRAPGRDRLAARLGRPPDRLRGAQARRRRLPPAPVPGPGRAARAARPRAEDHGRRQPLPDHQAAQGHARAAGPPHVRRSRGRRRGAGRSRSSARSRRLSPVACNDSVKKSAQLATLPAGSRRART